MKNKRPLKTIYTCFPGGKHKVLTMSYDDGKSADRRLIEIFNKYGIKGTFHLNSGLMAVDEERIQPDNVYLMHGNQIAVKTLDLNKDFLYHRELGLGLRAVEPDKRIKYSIERNSCISFQAKSLWKLG